jgi:phage repressor protein C with HTH and peptisase S24 domain
VLAVTVDRQNRENIELVPMKAAAGYLAGYADPEFLEELPHFHLPMLPQGTYRAFEITGDSMLPMQPGSVIIGEYAEDWTKMRDGTLCIVVSRNDGIVFKRVHNRIESEGRLSLHSDNPAYLPYDLPADEVIEVWRAKAFISLRFPDSDLSLEKLAGIVMDLQKEVIKMKG